MNTSNNFTDETLSNVNALNFANVAISLINNECDLDLPKFENVLDDYSAIADSWLTNMIGSYLSYGIKMNDASMNEAVEYKTQFLTSLQAFKNSPNGAELVSNEYKSADFGGIYGMDTSGAVDMGWFGPSNKGAF
jgi:hypothetical protein